MLSLEDASKLWQITIKCSPDLATLKDHVQPKAVTNPCVEGLRSICWKTFLLFRNTDRSTWSALLAESREAYSSLRDHLLKYVNRPGEFGSAVDPLNDDNESPWNTLRKDEELRAEILQDVERCMPEEPYFRLPETQRILLDVLFIFCKLNQDVGYRQGMHELLAPILWVVEKDAIMTEAHQSSASKDLEIMQDVLNANYVEHDSFTLFALIMQSAKSFYELGEPNKKPSISPLPGQEPQTSSPIVARSERIHKVLLAQVDPELATHLTDIEILPQIFLIRWIRLLFGREFVFDHLLALWDTLFAKDPSLDLVDLICVSMLLRIRWQLMDADYSIALTLLLKYPTPESDAGPQTFVEDAIFLKEHFDQHGGSTLISKHTGRAPSPSNSITSPEKLSPERRPVRRRSPLPSPASFIRQQGGVEAILQGAAKGIYARGERLGVNQAVRDAMEEVKKNMQNLAVPSPSSSMRGLPSDESRWSLDDGQAIPSRRRTMAAMETRNKQLALMLEEALKDLRVLQASDLEARPLNRDSVDIAVAKIQFVQVYLEDMSMPLPSDDTGHVPAPAPPASSTISLTSKPPNSPLPQIALTQAESDHLLKEAKYGIEKQPNSDPLSGPSNSSDLAQASSSTISTHTNDLDRPKGPMPTRSTLAQSSFSWMLESEDAAVAAAAKQTPSKQASRQARKPIPSANREKNAFLFGDEGDNDPIRKLRRPSAIADPDEGFNLGTIKGRDITNK